jgi:cystathionine gamma-synthase
MTMNDTNRQPETDAVHAGQAVDPATGALTPPIHLSTTFERDADGDYRRGYSYSREANPNRAALEQALAALEMGGTALAFSSGSAAMMTVLQSLEPGDHVVAPEDIYYGVRLLLTDLFGRWGLRVTFVDMTDLAQVQAALRQETRLVMFETPSNPQINISDIAAISAAAHEIGAQVLVDNTIATPVLQQPLTHGADFVVHATTKYLGGHSDVLGGALVAREADHPLLTRAREIQHIGGAVPSPFECWLALRGMQTLAVRMNQISQTALQVAQFLGEHPGVERVLYAGLPSHPGHDIAARQMRGFGGLMSILVKGGADDAMRVAGQVRLFTRATSFGGTHSLIEHRASIEATGTKTPPNLLRLSIGLEAASDLIADLDQALASL